MVVGVTMPGFAPLNKDHSGRRTILQTTETVELSYEDLKTTVQTEPEEQSTYQQS